MKREVTKGNLEAVLEIAVSSLNASPFWTPPQREGARFLTKTLVDAFDLDLRDALNPPTIPEKDEQ